MSLPLESAILESRFTYRFPPMLAADPVEINERFPLPKAIADFYAASAAATDAALERVRTGYVATHAARMFPHGEDSVQLLNQLYVAPFPRAIEERSDNGWGVYGPEAAESSA
jgi:hypothetical protein